MPSIDFYVNERATAAQRLHWHLSRAAAIVLQADGEGLGPLFEQEMILAERARREWHDAQDAIERAEPDHGSGVGSGAD